MRIADLKRITTIHTLGPSGTNCEKAAYEWFAKNEIVGNVILYPTLETAVEKMPKTTEDALLGCVVYPDLHTLVFSNLHQIELAECFVMPTFNMVLASRNGVLPARVATHPAPQQLVPNGCEKVFVNSNTQAAIDCASGLVEGCITTLVAAQQRDLAVVQDHGPVPMGFSIHVAKRMS